MTHLLFALTLCLLCLSCALRADTLINETFQGTKLDARWQVHCSEGAKINIREGSAEIESNLNAYAHLSTSPGMDNITATACIKPSQPAGVTWCTSIFFFWTGGDWCQMGIISAPAGGSCFYAVETRNSVTTETYLDPCDLDEWNYVRIELAEDCIRYYASGNGKTWKCLRIIERPQEFKGAPASLVAGKGYGRGTDPYPNPELNNNYADLGPRVVSYISQITAQKTPSKLIKMTAAERKKLAEADLDPVGIIELRGTKDPAYDRISRYYPPMKYPKEAVGVPEHPVDIAVDHLGRLQLNYDQPPMAFFKMGDPPVPFGDEKTPISRKLIKGYIPVVILATKRGSVQYEQTVFGWSEGYNPDKPLYAFLRLRARSNRGGELPKNVALCLGAEKRRVTLPMTQSPTKEEVHAKSTEKALIPQPLPPILGEGELQFPSPSIGRGARGEGLSDSGRESVNLTSTPKEAEVCVKVPWPTVDQAQTITSKEFDGTLNSTVEFWDKMLAKSARFEIPERRVNEAYKAWIAYSLLEVDKVNGVYEPHDGIGFYEVNYGYSACLYCIALDMYGMHDKAELYLDSILHFQQPDGLYTQNFGLPDMGALLLALSEHYNYTGDTEWLKRVSGSIIKACDWLIQKRADAPKTGPLKGLIKYRAYCDYFEPVYNYFADTYCCIGMEKAAQALKSVGMVKEANRLSDEARRYRTDILTSMDASAVRRDDRTMLPLEPETCRLLKDNGYTGGEYYGLTVSCLLENEFLPADDKRSRWVTDLIEQKRGLIAGLSKFGSGGVDHAYTYGYLMTQLRRDEVRKVILGLYSMLAYGMTRDTYSGVECTSIVTGANYWTLPHLYSCTQQLRLLRNMLIREEGDTLWIGQAAPRDWLKPGKRVTIKSAPTRFGPVSCRIVSNSNGNMSVRLDPPAEHRPKEIRIRLRHPSQLKIAEVKTTPPVPVEFEGEDVVIKNPSKSVDISVSFQAPGLTITRAEGKID